MYVLLVRCDLAGHRSTVHLVNDEGLREYSTATMQRALRWLLDRGEPSIVVMTDAGPEVFLIEPCEGLQLTLPSLSLRRAHLGRCCDLPAIPGLRPDPTRRARLEAGQAETNVERRRRRSDWVRRASGGAANDN